MSPKMLLSKLFQVAAILGLCVIGSNANAARKYMDVGGGEVRTDPEHSTYFLPCLLGRRYANASIAAITSSQSGMKSSPTPSTITSTASLIQYLDSNGSCNANVTINLFDLFVPSLQALPSTDIWLSYWAEQTKIDKLESTVIDYIQGITAVTNIPAFFSTYTSLYYDLQSAVSSVWECYIDGQVQYQNMALSDPCLFKTCRNQFRAQSSSFASASPDNAIFWYTAQPPCCGQCSVYGNGVEVEYWPTPAPTPLTTALVGTGPNGVIST
jgi:hypothetical protein